MTKLIDSVSGLPHYLSFLPSLEKVLRQDAALGMLLIQVDQLDPIEEIHGPQAYDETIREIAKLIDGFKGSALRQSDMLAVGDIVDGSGFMIFLSEKRSRTALQNLAQHEVETVADRVYNLLLPKIFAEASKYMQTRPKLSIGYSLVVNNPLIRPIRLVQRLIEEAREMSRMVQPRTDIKNKEKLQRLVLNEEIRTLYQPILELGSGKTIGYEALSRGPEGTIFENPKMLFSLARETGLAFELDRLCRKRALQNSKDLPSDAKIFVNILPSTIHDPEFQGQHLKQFLHALGKRPSNLVFEITEQAAIENLPRFREALKHFTDMGVRIAVDDTGTGYATLEAVVELNPHFLKLDMAMIQGVSKNKAKQEILKMLEMFASRIDAQIIAEGIEDEADLEMIKEIGLRYGQGYYFAKPARVEDLLGSNVRPIKRRTSR